MAVSISFDGFELNDGIYTVKNYPPLGMPNKETSTLDIGRGDGGVNVFQKFNSRTIPIQGVIVCSSSDELEQAIDALNKQMRRETGTLAIDYVGGTRMWQVIPTKVVIDRIQGQISYTPFSLEFEAPNPFATDGITDTIVNAHNTTTQQDFIAATVNGTMDALPLITITITAINPSVSPVEISIGNSTNSQYLTVERTFTAGDVLTIDCENFRVFHNGVFIKATGQFPNFAVGPISLDYSDTATTRNVSITATAERRYL